jgi:hypothetical protein
MFISVRIAASAIGRGHGVGADQSSAPHADTASIVDPIEQDLNIARREVFVNGPMRSLPMAVIVDDEDPAFRKPREEVL